MLRRRRPEPDPYHRGVCARCGDPWPCAEWQADQIRHRIAASIFDGSFGVAMTATDGTWIVSRCGARLPVLDPWVRDQLHAAGWQPVLNDDGILVGVHHP